MESINITGFVLENISCEEVYRLCVIAQELKDKNIAKEIEVLFLNKTGKDFKQELFKNERAQILPTIYVDRGHTQTQDKRNFMRSLRN